MNIVEVRNIIRRELDDKSLLTVQHVVSYKSLMCALDSDHLEYIVKSELRQRFAREVVEKMLNQKAVAILDTPEGRMYRLEQVCISYKDLVSLCDKVYTAGINRSIPNMSYEPNIKMT